VRVIYGGGPQIFFNIPLLVKTSRSKLDIAALSIEEDSLIARTVHGKVRD